MSHVDIVSSTRNASPLNDWIAFQTLYLIILSIFMQRELVAALNGKRVHEFKRDQEAIYGRVWREEMMWL